MWATAIVEVEISADRATGLADAFIGSQIDLLVFDATPQPLDEHVVTHANLDGSTPDQAYFTPLPFRMAA